jgi:hypothetical protein
MHALNPWGFAHGRRVNERNVDLNRNFHVVAAYAQRMPTLYAALDPLLNPASAPRPDAFLLRAAGYVLRYGVRACRQAIAEGQDAFPRGLFYGGRELEEGPRRVLDWLRGHLAGAQRLLVLDLHTGLGRFGQQTLLAEPDMPHERVASLAHALGAHARGGAGRSDPGGFAAHATFAAALAPTLGHVQPEFFTVEYGTYSGLRVLYALREENRWHHYGDGSLSHAVKARLAETFAPASARWRSAAVSNGDRLLRAAAAAIAREDFATL